MEVTVHIPDEVAQQMSSNGQDLSRSLLEAIAINGFRRRVLTLYQAGQILGLSRLETESFMGRNQVPLADITTDDLDREAALFEAAQQRRPR
jgi:predicted HTH domain antitoxin